MNTKKKALKNKIYTFYGVSNYTLEEVCLYAKKLISETFVIEELKLFGSYSREEQTEDSDVDLFLVYSNKDKKEADIKIAEIMTELNFKFACPINISAIPFLSLEKNTLFYRNIQKDGIDI